MSMHLPIEVLEAIIDQASDNTVSLRHLSLTCTTLLPRSRYHLFSGLLIRTVQQLEASSEFLDSCPWLASLVRKVTLFVTIPRDNSKPNIRLLDVVPIHLLTRLPKLRAWTMGAGDNESTTDPSLSLHHSALRCYRKHGDHIRSLELSIIFFSSLSDFRGLVSAFTGLDSLTCYGITFKSREREDASTSPVVGVNIRSLQISTLKICTSVDNWAVEYLLACSASKLKHLSLQLRTQDCRNGGLKQLEQSITWFTGLSSLELVVFPGSNYTRIEDFSRVVRSATRIIQRVNRSCLTDVRVEFKADPISNLGTCLSGASAPLEACKRLEAALLTFPNSPVLVRDPVRNRRAGRAELWSPIIRRAFPRLNQQGRLTFNFESMCSKGDAPDPLGHENQVACVVISRDSARAATSSSDGTIIVWDMASKSILQQWPAHEGVRVATLALSPDSRRLVSAGGHALAVWGGIDSDVARKAAELDGHTDVVSSSAWSPDGALIASASPDRTVRVWDGHTYQQRDLLPANPFSQEAQSLQFSPDARCLAWISGRMDCCVWRPLTGEQPKTLRPHPDRRDVRTTAFSFDREGRCVATAHGNRDSDPDACIVRVWDAATGAALAVLAGHAKTVLNVSFSLDGRSLLSMADDMSVRVWDRGTWSAEQTEDVFGDAESLTSQPCFRPDGKYVATGTGSVQGLARLCRTSDGSCVATFDEHDSTVTHIAFSPNGQFLVSGDTKGIVHIHPLSRFIGE